MVATFWKLTASADAVNYYLGTNMERDNYYTAKDQDALRWVTNSDVFAISGTRISDNQFRDAMMGYVPDHLYEEGADRYAKVRELDPDMPEIELNRGPLVELLGNDPQGRLKNPPDSSRAWRAMRATSGKSEHAGHQAIAGSDLQLSLPKPFSILWAKVECGKNESLKKRLNDALFRANAAAILELPRMGGVVCDVVIDGQRQDIPSESIHAATASHTTSREGDPQIHFHNVVFNFGTRTDESGKIHRYAIDLGEINRRKFAIDAKFKANVARELRKIPELANLVVEDPKTGSATIRDVPDELVTHFSKRSISAKVAAAQDGRNWSEMTKDERQHFVTKTRDVKDPSMKGDVRKEVWAEDFQTIADYDYETLNAQGREVLRVETAVERDNRIIAEAIRLVGDDRATWEGHDLERFIDDLTGGCQEYDYTEEEAFALYERALKEQGVIVPRPKDGRVIYATRRQVQLEKEILAQAECAAGARRFVSDKQGRIKSVVDELERRNGWRIKEEQLDALKAAIERDDRLTVINGVAGSGKSTTARAIKMAFTGELAAAGEIPADEQYRVIGMAPSWKAADELHGTAGIDACYAIQGVVAELKRRERGQGRRNYEPAIDSKTVIILDEAGMVSTEQLAYLLREVERQDARLILMGDVMQLSAVEAGNPMAEIVDKYGHLCSAVTTVRRQSLQWQREAIEQMSKKNAKEPPANKFITTDGRVIMKTDDLQEPVSPVQGDWKARRNAIDFAQYDWVELEGLPAGERLAAFEGAGYRLLEANKRLIVVNADNQIIGGVDKVFGRGVDLEDELGIVHNRSDFAKALERFNAEDRVAMHMDNIDAVDAITQNARRVIGEGNDHLAIAATNDDVVALNLQMRQVRRDHGLITGPDYEVDVITRSEERQMAARASETVSLEKTRKIQIAQGDKLLFGEMVKLPDNVVIKRSQIGTVLAISASANGRPDVTLDLGEGQTVRVNWDQLMGEAYPDTQTGELPTRAVRVQHFYACTAQSSQGMTIDNGEVDLLAHAGLSSNAALVGMSRHTEDVRIHVDMKSYKVGMYESAQDMTNPQKDEVWAKVVQSIETSRQKTNALKTVNPDQVKVQCASEIAAIKRYRDQRRTSAWKLEREARRQAEMAAEEEAERRRAAEEEAARRLAEELAGAPALTLDPPPPRRNIRFGL